MPGGNRTGPRGGGPMTGRAAGFCAGYEVPGYANPVPGFGRGMAYGRGGWGMGRGFRGGGRGWRNMYYATGMPGWARYGGFEPGVVPAPPVPQDENEALRAEADWLESRLDAIRGRLSELDTSEE